MICWVLAMQMLRGVWKQHLRPRAVVGYTALTFFFPVLQITSPDHLESVKLFSRPLFTSLLLTLSQICGIHISDPSCCEISNFLTSSAELLLFGTASDALESLPISSVFSSGVGPNNIPLECLLACSFKPSTGIFSWRVVTFLKDELSSLGLSCTSEETSHDWWHDDLVVAFCWRKLCINVLTLQNIRE